LRRDIPAYIAAGVIASGTGQMAIARRKFIATLGGGMLAWPLTVRAQQAPRLRRLGILMPFSPTDTVWRSRVAALRQELERLKWTQGENIEFDERWTTDNMDLVRANAANLVELKPDAIVAVGGRVIPILMQLTRTVPIICPGAVDAVGLGYAESLARPGGNVTGFSTMESSVFGKILGTLKQIAPGTSRVAMIYNPDNPGTIQFRLQFESFAVPLSVQPIYVPIHSITDIERAIEALAEQPNGGAFFPPDITITALRDQVTALVARHRVPAIYTDRIFVTSGGLASYDADRIDIFRRAASYVDRILHGEKPADMPFQQPTQYQLTLNPKAAKAIGLTIPRSLLDSADEVIE
jgi:putative ABC transport system substrate-binding protein